MWAPQLAEHVRWSSIFSDAWFVVVCTLDVLLKGITIVSNKVIDG